MIKLLLNFFNFLITLKIFNWIEPNAKKFFYKVVISLVLILIIIYLHNEFLDWVQFSKDKKYLTSSFFIKNLLILLIIAITLFSLKGKKTTSITVSGEEKLYRNKPIYQNKPREDFFEKFRYENKKQLKSKTQKILDKYEKKK